MSDKKDTKSIPEEKMKQQKNIVDELRDSRRAALNLMEDALEARRQAEQTSENLLKEIEVRKKVEDALRESESRVSRKLESVLSPEGDISSLELSDIIDVPALQELMNNFHKLTNIPMAIIDLKGKVLVGVGWQKVCTEFHRKHPKTCKYCIESDTELTTGIPEGRFKLYKCKNNLWDVATPIKIGDRQVGNIFTGQFFFEDEKLDYEFFRSQAKKYGFDEKEYIAALDKVPHLSRETVDNAMAYFLKLSNMISQLSYGNIKLARILTERDRLTDELRKSHDELEARVIERTEELNEAVIDLQKQVAHRIRAEEATKAERKRLFDVLETLPVMVCLLKKDYHVAFANGAFKKKFGEDKGRRYHEYRFDKTEPSEFCESYKVFETGKPHHWEVASPDGSSVIDAYDFPFTDADGSPMILEMDIDITEQRRAEQLIKAERQRMFDVLETLPAYVCLLTPDYHMPFANKKFRDWFGYQPDKKCHEFLFGRNEPCDNCETYNVLKTGMPQEWEWTGPNNHNYSIYDFPFKDTDGSQLILEMGIDITEQKKAQEQLRSASRYTRGLIEASLDPLVTISEGGKITDVNEATVKVTGVSREQLIGDDFTNYFTEPQKAKQSYQQVFADGFVTDYPLTIRHRSGQLIDVLYNAAIYTNESGQVQGVFAAARDITERKAAQEKQNVTNSLLELFVRKTSRKSYLDSTVEIIRNWSGCEFVGIRVKDNEGNIPYEAYVGFDQDFLAKENMLHLKGDNCLCVRAILEQPQKQEMQIMTQGGSFFCNDSLQFLNGIAKNHIKEYRGYCVKKGFQSIAVIPIRYRDEVYGAIHITDYQKNMVPLEKIQFIESTISPLIGEAIHRFNAEAELGKYRLHLEDLVKERTEDLSRSNRDLEQFAYVASHDLQEPLRAVAGFVELLRRNLKATLDSKTTEYMDFSIDGVKRMQALISGLLEYSRIGTQGKQPEQTDPIKALDIAISHLQTSIKESGAKIKFDSLPMVHYDPLQLTQLFQNLIGNAIKFRGDKPPVINVTAEKIDGGWKFAVADNGIGIDTQYADKIFLIFQRLHSREKYPGTGIGLSICKKIVERHNGRIWVESQSGKGSTFYFTAH